MATLTVNAAAAEIESLCRDYDRLADSREAGTFAALYIADGQFDRLGVLYIGRKAIASLVEDRSADLRTRHTSSNFRIQVDVSGRTASGRVDLHLQRWREGSGSVEPLRVQFSDEYVLTDEGWRFSKRKATSIAGP